MIWERHLEHWIVGLRVGPLNDLFIALSWIGSFGTVWLALSLVLASAWRRPSVLVMVAVADGAGELLADLGKLVVPRHRPFEHQLGPPSSTHSFPSGHTTTSFACATVLSALVPRWRVPLFALAALIGLSRIYNGMHYPTDVLAGAALGVLTARLLLAAIRRRSRPAPPRG